uniref:Retrotransposon gag domain-containing protein n=1 Tax=Mycena chlorophos TaxID=658473 RepID=A0ABQ0L2F3_MYCCL|nr:predicted protein [Mycena chlorophos]
MSGVAPFRIPQPWDRDRPHFDTDAAEDLLDFLDQMEIIFTQGQITDDQHKKEVLTGFLSYKKRALWRSWDTYGSKHSFADFQAKFKSAYPELRVIESGLLSQLKDLCSRSKGINKSEQGKLRRFGLEFTYLVNKLQKSPAVLSNSEACSWYLQTLNPEFAQAVQSMASMFLLFKDQFTPLPNLPALPNMRKEDPVHWSDLMQTAESLAANPGLPDNIEAPSKSVETKSSDKSSAQNLQPNVHTESGHPPIHAVCRHTRGQHPNPEDSTAFCRPRAGQKN